MPRIIAINGTRLDEVQMPLEPYGNGTVAHLTYPLSQISYTRSGHGLRLIIPAYLAVELYRTAILSQDEGPPLEVSIGGRSVGWYLVSDVRYPNTSDGPFGKVIFTLSRVPHGSVPHAAGALPPVSQSATGANGAYVTDIRHYLDATGELAPMPGTVSKLASFLTLLIDAATEAFPTRDHDSGIRCRQKACRGSIQTSLASEAVEIFWQCPACQHHGIITNWQTTKWNRLKHSERS